MSCPLPGACRVWVESGKQRSGRVRYGPTHLTLAFDWCLDRWVLRIKDGSIIKRFATKRVAVNELRFWAGNAYCSVNIERKNGTLQEVRVYNK